MLVKTIHTKEVKLSLELVKQLLKEQFPDWASQDLQPLMHQGTDNVMLKLGDDKIIRLPRTLRAEQGLKKECLWLPRLGSKLPVQIPHIQGIGQPIDNYPYQWAIVNYLEGDSPCKSNSLDLTKAAADLGNFIKELQKVNTTNAPLCKRGQPLITRDKETMEFLGVLSGDFDTKLLGEMWSSMLKVPHWERNPVWLHGDLHAGNLLAQGGRLTGVIDFGMSGVGDPACDVMVAWSVLDQNTRELFRSVAEPDEATWKRAQGWALHFGIVACAYYKTRDPLLAVIAQRTLEEVVADLI